MNWVRKNNLIAVAVAGALLSLFLLLFMDPLIKWGIVKAGQGATGAKVEVGSVKTKLLAGRVTLRRVAAANKNEPMKNLFELKEAVLELQPKALLRAKVVITEASLSGLEFGTARRRSGALMRSKPSALERMIQKELAPVQQASLAKLTQAKQAAKIDIDPKKLLSLKALDDAQANLKNIPGRWKDKLSVAKIDQEIKAVTESLKSLQGGGSSPADILRKTKTVKEAQEKLKALSKDVQSSQEALKQEFGSLDASLKSADALKGKDLNGLMAAAGLPQLDAESLAKRLVGPAASEKLSTSLYWIAWARRKAAASSSSQKQTEAPPRRRGITVEFPLEDSYPAFLLEKAALSGTLASVLEGQDMNLSGSLLDVTSNPPLYGKPSRLFLKGETPRKDSRMTLEATLDQTRRPGGAEVKLQYSGLPLAGTSLGDKELGADITAGAASVDGTVSIVGDEWKGRIVLKAENVSLKPRLGLEGPAGQFAAAALQGIRRFTATVAIEGKENDLHFKIDSNLGQAIAEAMKKGVSSQLAGQRKLVEEKLNALYAERAKDLRGQASGLQASLMGPLDQQQSTIQKALKDAAGKSFGKSLPGLDRLFR